MLSGMNALELVILFPTLVSIALYLAVLAAFLLAGRPTVAPSAVRPAPRVSILKPLAGSDDELVTNLESFAALDYPEYELLLGVASFDDPALPVAREFVRTHPSLEARVVLTDPASATNPKVAQLMGLERAATGEVLVVSDSNVRVPPDYLEHLVGKLAEPAVGLVSNLVLGRGESTVGAAIENLQLSAAVAPTILASARLLGLPITVGKSMAMWKSALTKLGGFRAVADVLAEDYALGQHVARAGYRVEVSTAPVYNWNSDCTLARTVERHTRWAKLRRAVSPVTFAFEPLLLPLLVAVGSVVVVPHRAAMAVLLVAAAVQVGGAMLIQRFQRGQTPGWRLPFLEILRTAVVFVCWCRACVSRRVSWRGHQFELGPLSRPIPVSPRVVRRPTIA